MVPHFRVERDFDTEQSGQLSLQPVQPVASVLEVAAGQRIGATEKSPTYSSSDLVFGGGS